MTSLENFYPEDAYVISESGGYISFEAYQTLEKEYYDEYWDEWYFDYSKEYFWVDLWVSGDTASSLTLSVDSNPNVTHK